MYRKRGWRDRNVARPEKSEAGFHLQLVMWSGVNVGKGHRREGRQSLAEVRGSFTDC